jgi:uncharacterized membrane protein HdeD (DUF308 family)
MAQTPGPDFSTGGPLLPGLHALRRNWGWFLALGILLILGGMFALGAAAFTTLLTMIFVGWLLVFEGIIHIILAIRAWGWNGVGLHLLFAILSIIVGIMFLNRPGLAAETLTLLLAVFFTVGGLYQIFAGFSARFHSWEWAVLGGVVDLVLGLLIWNRWPSSALWVIGAFVGIDFIFKGWECVMAALAVRRIPAGGV